ncbi:Ger(x)C family spore germination protein [Alicyclobacillus tolerans]|nr:Ger(x)C family spore germination protein [Alicyclobacillus tengchongensis]
MNNMVNKYLLTGFMVCMLLFIPGCWDYQAMNTKALAIGMAIDQSQDSNPEKFRVTIQYPVFSGSLGEGGGSSENGKNHAEESAEGYTLGEILRSIQLKINRNLDLSQIQTIVLSSQLRREMQQDILEDLIREPRTNRMAYMVSSPFQASDVLSAKLDKISASDDLSKRFGGIFHQNGYYISRTLWEFWRDQTLPGYASSLPLIRPWKDQTGKVNRLLAEGITVYPPDGKVFTLSKKQTLSVNFLLGTVKNMNLDIPYHQKIVSLSSVYGESQMRCFRSNSKMILYARIYIHGILGKRGHVSLANMPPANVMALQNSVEQYERMQILQTLKLLQKHGADVLGYGEIYLQKHPEQEQQVRSNWNRIFQKASVEIDVQAWISSKGVLM